MKMKRKNNQMRIIKTSYEYEEYDLETLLALRKRLIESIKDHTEEIKKINGIIKKKEKVDDN